MNAQQLKNSILQLAVQGKLVSQDPNDEPASILIERIKAEKERLIKEKKIKPDKNQSYIFRGSDNLPYEKIGNETRCIAEDIPFDIPDSWEWCRVGDLFTNMSGLSYKKENLLITTDNMIRVLRGGNIGSESYSFKEDDIFISQDFVKSDLLLKKNYMITPAVSSIEHIGKVALLKESYTDVVVGGFVLILIPLFNIDVMSKYLLYCFAAKHHRDNCRNITHKSGQAFYNLSREKLMNLAIPLPPLEEQERIVAKIEELMPLIEEYDKAGTKNNELNLSFPDKLKKSILQEAVQGKLIPQDPNDEPASVLIEQIRKEKEQLIKDKKIKKDKNESYIFRRDNSHYEKIGTEERCIDDEIPFDIPASWEWTRLGNVINLTSGQDLTPDMYNAKQKGIPYITGASNIEDGKIIINRWTDKGRAFAYRGDLLLTCKGTIGTMAFLTEEKAHIARQIMGISTYKQINIDFVKIFLESYINILKAKAKSMIPGISRDDVLNILFPSPPLSEQQRIVDKVNQLLPQISKL